MALWWIGNVILLFVVVPVTVVLLDRVLSPILTIKQHVDDILENGVILTGELDGVPELLAETDRIVGEVATGALRYANRLDRVVSGS